MSKTGSKANCRKIRPRTTADIVEFLKDETAAYYGVVWGPENTSPRCDLARRLRVLPAKTATDSESRVVELYLIRGDTDQEYVRVESEQIEHLAAYESLPEWFLEPPGQTLLQRAKQQWRLAKVAPDRVSVPELLELTETGDNAVQYICLKALQTAIESTDQAARFESLITVAKALATDADDPAVRKGAIDGLTTAARSTPEDIEPFLPELVELLDPEDPRVTLSALQCLIKLAEHDPAECRFYISDIDWCLRTETFLIRHQMITFIATVASAHPEEVRRYTDELIAACSLDTYPLSHVTNALSAVGHISRSYPEDVVDRVPFLIDLVEGTHKDIRKNAAGILCDIARLYSTELTDHVPTLIQLLFDDDSDVRRNGSLVVSLIAEDFPDGIGDYLDEITAKLTDSNPIVRENICWTLGHLQSQETREILLEHQQRESEPGVLEALSWAVTQIDTDPY
jgi:HEAT repeat protein